MTTTLALTLPFILPIPAAQMPCPFKSPWSLFRISSLFLIADFPHCNPSSVSFFSQNILASVNLQLYYFSCCENLSICMFPDFPWGDLERRRGCDGGGREIKQMAAFRGVKEAKSEQRELCVDLGVRWRGGDPDASCRKGPKGVCSGTKLSELELML